MSGHRMRNKEQGFTLLEIMLAVTFFAVAFVSLMEVYNTGMVADLYLDRSAIAVNLAQEKMEELKRGSYVALAPGTTIEASVSAFPFFSRNTQINLIGGTAMAYKVATVSVFWTMSGARQNYTLTTFVSDY
ncbi:MAG: type II secretion system protein [Candidatus Omnitrophota bacterium]